MVSVIIQTFCKELFITIKYNRLKKDGFTHIRLMCLVGSPQGVKAVRDNHPDVDIYLASLDEGLNEKNYILPGLGDAGDRIFGTK